MSPMKMATKWWQKHEMLGSQRDGFPCTATLRQGIATIAFRDGVKAERARARKVENERWQAEQRAATKGT